MVADAGPLDLGGGIRIHPGVMVPELVPADTIQPHPRNPRRGDETAIGESLDTNGLYDQVKVQRSTGFILSGNHTYKTLVSKGAERVPVVWLDVDDAEATRVMLSANRTGDRGTYEGRMLVELLRDDLGGDTTGTGYTREERDLMFRVANTEAVMDLGEDRLLAELAAFSDIYDDEPEHPTAAPYARRTKAVQYEPQSELPPPIEALIDREKADQLTASIRAAHLPSDVQDFLLAATQRHLVFNYAAIAEFYSHASPPVQALMEASALVIVDMEDAIEHGYMRLGTRLAELLDLDLNHRSNPGA